MSKRSFDWFMVGVLGACLLFAMYAEVQKLRGKREQQRQIEVCIGKGMTDWQKSTGQDGVVGHHP